jgi:hypothetical protein
VVLAWARWRTQLDLNAAETQVYRPADLGGEDVEDIAAGPRLGRVLQITYAKPEEPTAWCEIRANVGALLKSDGLPCPFVGVEELYACRAEGPTHVAFVATIIYPCAHPMRPGNSPCPVEQCTIVAGLPANLASPSAAQACTVFAVSSGVIGAGPVMAVGSAYAIQYHLDPDCDLLVPHLGCDGADSSTVEAPEQKPENTPEAPAPDLGPSGTKQTVAP